MKKIINAFLDLDPESKARLKKLEGKTVNIVLLPFQIAFHFTVINQQMEIATGEAEKAETTIRGTPLQLMGVMIDSNNRHQFFADDLVMEGNAELGQQMVSLFDEMEIDWEEIISHFAGDIPAYHLGRTVRGIKSWVKQAGGSLTQNVDEYVHEEAMWFPTREALQDFFNDIDTLRMDVDRIEARIMQLKR